MDKISSRWYPVRSRPSKKKQRALLMNQKRWSKTSEIKVTTSRTEKKLALFSHPELSEDKSLATSHTFVSDEVWPSLLRDLKCEYCSENCLTVSKTTEFGFSSKLHVKCSSCGQNYGPTFSSSRMLNQKSFTINKDMVEAFLSIGKGHSAMEKFSMALGLTPMDIKTFNKYVRQLADEAKDFKTRVLCESQKAVIEEHGRNGDSPDAAGILNVSVSYDGTWMKRGHTSLYGIGIVVDVLTGLVVDYEIVSKYCHLCEVSKNDLGENSMEYSIWFESHRDTCDKNYSGSSNAMEMFAAGILWKRSVETCKMRYTVILSDGDSKTYCSLLEKNVYEGYVIEKHECVNHIAKRLGTALRNKVKEFGKIKNERLGGRKRGNLTDATITRLQNYYRKAIVENAPDINKMKTAIFASLHHCSSTDDKPSHKKCPTGANSWCFFNRAKASGKKPASHKMMKTFLSSNVVAKILPVYQRLANDELLKRCTGKTQNANESLHNSIWKACPKETFVSKKRLEKAVISAISNFNMGCAATVELSSSKPNAKKIADKIDSRRVRQSVNRSSLQYREKMLKRKYAAKKSEKKIKKTEGESYCAGGF